MLPTERSARRRR